MENRTREIVRNINIIGKIARGISFWIAGAFRLPEQWRERGTNTGTRNSDADRLIDAARD